MNKLYYFSAYSYRLNQWDRFLVTATATDSALAELEAYLEDSGFSTKGQRFICDTPDNTFTEL